jgi:hypothetical protein
MKNRKDKEDLRATFAATLRDALQRHRKRTGESGRAVCDELGLGEKGYRWLRKISSKGISHIRTDRRADLQKICDHIGLAQSWLFDIDFGRAGELSTDFARVIALGIAEVAKQSATPTDIWQQIGEKFQSDLEDIVAVLLHKFTGEFSRHLNRAIATEASNEQIAENKMRRGEQTTVDKRLWDDKTTAFPLMRKEIVERHCWRDKFEEDEIDEGTWQYTSLGDGCIEISVEATHRVYRAIWGRGEFRKGKLNVTFRRRWKATMFLNGGWIIYGKGIEYSPIDQPQPEET